jgi:hypothetical protein
MTEAKMMSIQQSGKLDAMKILSMSWYDSRQETQIVVNVVMNRSSTKR